MKVLDIKSDKAPRLGIQFIDWFIHILTCTIICFFGLFAVTQIRLLICLFIYLIINFRINLFD